VETSGREGGFDQRPKALKLNCAPASIRGRTTSRKTRGLFRRCEGLRISQEAANDRRAGSPRRDKPGDGDWRGKGFEGCSRRRERRKPGNPQGNPGRNPKLGEPQDRQRGATNPRSFVRSKPSRRRETAKVERDLPGGKGRPTCGSRRGRQLLPSRSTGVDARSPSRWKGDLWKPQERNLTARSGRKNWKASPSGRRRESW